MRVKYARWLTPKSDGFLLKLTDEGWNATLWLLEIVVSWPVEGLTCSSLGYNPEPNAALTTCTLYELQSSSVGMLMNLVARVRP